MGEQQCVDLAISHNVAANGITDILGLFGDFSLKKESIDGQGRRIAFGHFSQKKNAIMCTTLLDDLRYSRHFPDFSSSDLFLIQARTDFRCSGQPDPFKDVEPNLNREEKLKEVWAGLNAATVHQVCQPNIIPNTGTQILAAVPSVLPMPGYCTYDGIPSNINSSSGTKRINKDKICLWNDFTREVREDNLAGFERSIKTASFHENTKSFYVEETVKKGFTNNVCDILETFLISGEKFGEPNSVEYCGELEPDYIFGIGKYALIVFEVKAARFMTPDIVAQYKLGCRNVCRAVNQIYRYMVQYKTKFGVLTTYNKTWFVKMVEGEGGMVEFSQAIPWDSTNPTVLHAMAHIIALARAEYQSRPKETPKDGGGGGGAANQVKETRKPSAEGPPKTPIRSRRLQGLPPGPTEPDKSGARNQSMGPVVILHDDIRFDKVVGRGRSGKVISGCWRGETVALKLYALRKKRGLKVDLGNELAAYAALDAIQGESIPSLKAHGYFGYFGASHYIMVLEMIGLGEQIVPSTLTADEIGKIEHIFEVIHQLGVLHGDVRSANILRWGSRFYVVDFGFANPHCSSAEDFCKEMDEVHSLLSGQLGDYY